jgi:hypothetical protein
MRTIKTYFKRAPFYNALIRTVLGLLDGSDDEDSPGTVWVLVLRNGYKMSD